MRCIVVGGNAAGMSAAAKLMRSEQDVQLTVYEQSGIVSYGACGLPYYIADYFSDINTVLSRSPEAFKKAGIDLRLHYTVEKVDAIHRKITGTDAEGEKFSDTYDVLVVASGASAIIPPIPGINTGHIYTLRSIDDGQRIKDALSETGPNAIVVGGGFIGLELAEALQKQGKSVRIIELEDRLLKAAVGPEVSTAILAELEAQGVSVSLSERVTAFSGDHQVSEVVTHKGTYPADIVVLSLGIRPNTSFLADTDIKRLSNGAVIVDHVGKSSIDSIYSAGDCAAVPQMITQEPIYTPLATTANKLGRIIGEHLGGSKRTFPGTLASACVKVFDLEVARVGITVESDQYQAIHITDKNQTAYYPGQEDILFKILFDKETKKLVGAETAGKNGAALRIDALAMAIQKEATIEDLALADFCYAPPFARTWDVMNIIGNVAISKS